MLQPCGGHRPIEHRLNVSRFSTECKELLELCGDAVLLRDGVPEPIVHGLQMAVLSVAHSVVEFRVERATLIERAPPVMEEAAQQNEQEEAMQMERDSDSSSGVLSHMEASAEEAQEDEDSVGEAQEL
jgi:hypothetical protein